MLCTLSCACRQEADSQAASLRSQAAAREERLAAQHASRLAALQSELDARGAAACDADSALAAARAEVTRLTQQVRFCLLCKTWVSWDILGWCRALCMHEFTR
jgi:hypothetical protein